MHFSIGDRGAYFSGGIHSNTASSVPADRVVYTDEVVSSWLPNYLYLGGLYVAIALCAPVSIFNFEEYQFSGV